MATTGQTRPKYVVRATSALPSIATEKRTSRFGSLVPIAIVSIAIGRPRSRAAFH
jgi:hypothetical protein